MSHPHSPDHCASAVNSLYCGEDTSEVVQQDADTWISSYHQSPSPSTIPSPPSDKNTITKLIDSESQFMPFPDYLHRCRHRSIDTTARQDSINWILKEMVRSCHQLMEEYLIDTCPLSRHKVLSAEASVEPASPVGVLDAAAACGSCDTRSENPISASSQAPETEPIIKRLRSSASDVQEP